MVTPDFKALTVPLTVVRILEVIFTCITFSLMASTATSSGPFWTWCLFTWCFCFVVSFLIIILEFTGGNAKLPISWDDFITAFAMLATLMVLAASIICSIFFTASSTLIGACVTSYLTFILYAIEVGMTRAKPNETRGFLSTIPGMLKVLEAFVACIIFICLGSTNHSLVPGIQWCVAVYSICFIFSLLVIVLTICRLLSLFPTPFNKVLNVCNVLAVLMYVTAVVIWPIYSFNHSKPNCSNGIVCPWNLRIVISFMTSLNLIAYIVDMAYSFRLVFVSRET